MQKLIFAVAFAMASLTIAGCALVYSPDVQEGNIIEKKTIDQLQPGMTKRQVLVLMGTPSATSPFNQNRWDYVSTRQHRGGDIKKRTYTLSFNNDTLVSTKGNWFADDAQQMADDAKKFKTGYSEGSKAGDKNVGTNSTGGEGPQTGPQGPEGN